MLKTCTINTRATTHTQKENETQNQRALPDKATKEIKWNQEKLSCGSERKQRKREGGKLGGQGEDDGRRTDSSHLHPKRHSVVQAPERSRAEPARRSVRTQAG